MGEESRIAGNWTDIDPARVNSVLVSRLRFMGDVILTTPLLAALRQRFPQARIGYLAETPYHQLLEHHPHVDDLFSYKRGDDRGQIALVGALRRRKWNVAIDLFGNPRSAMLLYLSSASFRIGGDFRGRRLLYTHRIADDGIRRTAIAYHLRYLAPLGLFDPPSPPFIAVTPAEREEAGRYLERTGFDLDAPIVGLHPGATWPAKRWFPDRFAALAVRLHDQGRQVLFTMGPGEEGIMAEVFNALPIALPKPEILPLRSLAALISRLTLFVSNDCGPLHLAPAVGTKTVGIFGPGEPDIWFPYDPAAGHRLVYHTIDCSHCHRDLCPDMFCMQAITVEDLLAAVDSSLTNPS